MFQKQTNISDFSNVIYTTSKNELKMMWLSRNTKLLDSFPHQKWGVKACYMWPGYLVLKKHKWRPHHTRQKNYGSHMITRIHNIARVNCCLCTYVFLKQTAGRRLKQKCMGNVLMYLKRFKGKQGDHKRLSKEHKELLGTL